MAEDFPFLTDILSQPKGLQDVIDGFDPGLLRDLGRRLQGGEFDRVVITGMGASTFGSYPAWLQLVQHGVPAFWADTSEVLAAMPHMITPRTLLWVVSNSGKSIEITRLLKRLGEFGKPFLLANSNDPESPLAQAADLPVPLYTGKDLTLSTKSYIGTLAVMQLMALTLAGQPIEQEMEDLRITQAGMAEYLSEYPARLKELDQLVGEVEQLAFVGRGLSYATATEGALCFQEGPKVHSLGLSTGQFWHGPVEVADSGYTLFAMAGEAAMQKEDEFLAHKAQGLGANVVWFSSQPADGLPTAILPKHRGIGLPMAEIVPVQLSAINVGKQTGFRPGDFRYLGTTVDTKKEQFPG